MSKEDFDSLYNEESNANLKSQNINLKRLKTLTELENIENEKNIKKEKINKLMYSFKKNFFVGFGVGLIVASIIFWIFGDNSHINDVESLEEKYTDAKLIEKAKELGMIFPSENLEETEITGENIQ